MDQATLAAVWRGINARFSDKTAAAVAEFEATPAVTAALVVHPGMYCALERVGLGLFWHQFILMPNGLLEMPICRPGAIARIAAKPDERATLISSMAHVLGWRRGGANVWDDFLERLKEPDRWHPLPT